MTQEVAIECGTGATAYKVFLTERYPDVFLAASRDERVRGKKGEALVQALLAAAPGGIRQVGRHRDGQLNDGPNGEPAIQEFNDSGLLVYAARYRDGKLNDGPNGEPARQEFSDSGLLVYTARYRDGKRNDGPEGEPALQVFNEKGALILADRYRDGALVKELDRSEIEAYTEGVRARAAADAIRAACPALRIL